MKVSEIISRVNAIVDRYSGVEEMDEAKFKRDAEDGMSVSALARQHGMSWADAKATRNRLAPQANTDYASCNRQGSATKAGKTEDIGAQEYTLHITVPEDRVGLVLGETEPATIIDAILQMDEDSQAAILQAVIQRQIAKRIEDVVQGSGPVAIAS